MDANVSVAVKQGECRSSLKIGKCQEDHSPIR